MTANYYIIDTSSLIELNMRYPMDVFPTLWKNVEGLIKKGTLISHTEVLKEISLRDDNLKKWAKKQKDFFRSITEKQMKLVRDILSKYPSLAKTENETAAADPFIIALAIELGKNPQKTLFDTGKSSKGHIIVTEEKLRGTRIRIPFVCQGYNINCIDIINMCRIEGWQF